MNTPEELLTLGSKEALYVMAQNYLDEHHPGIRAVWYRATDPIVVDGLLTKVLFSLDKTSTPVSKWDSLITFTITYYRMDISDVIGNDTSMNVTLPTTGYKVLRNYLSTFGIPLDESEAGTTAVSGLGIVDIEIDEGSYRWVGVAKIKVFSDNRALSEMIKVNNVVTDFSDLYSSVQVKRDIVRHLNEHNKSRLLPDLTFEHVQICCPVVAGDEISKINTRVRLKSNEGIYVGEGDIFYMRRNFNYTWRRPIELKWEGELMVSDAIAKINELLGCVISTTDFIDSLVTEPWRKNRTESTVQFKPESMGYVGELRIQFYDRY